MPKSKRGLHLHKVSYRSVNAKYLLLILIDGIIQTLAIE